MSGASRPWSAHADRTSGLRALADLVNDALQALGAQAGGVRVAAAGPAFGPRPLGPSLVRQSAFGATATPTSRLRRGPRALQVAQPDESTAPTGAPHDDGSGPGAAPSTIDTPDVDADHVETWRLVGLAQDGDGEAFGQLYDRYVDTVFRFIYYRVNDRGLAEDFTSETFLRALRRISTITYQGRDIGAWFITIARNIVFDHTKSARNRLETTTGETIESKDHERSTEAAVLETLQSEHLMQAVRKLGDEQRECVMLRFIQGLSVSETAAVMGKNDGAIKALQHRAVRKLADLVSGQDLR